MKDEQLRKLLVIEDEPSVAKQLQWGLGDKYEITVAADAEQVSRALVTSKFPVVTLDLGLPPFPNNPTVGLRILEEGLIPPSTKIIVITGNAEEETAVRAVRLGVTDFCPKPVDLEDLEVLINRAFRMHEIEAASERYPASNASYTFYGMLGTSPVMRKLFTKISRAAANDFPVLILGETGTGKEMIAQTVHLLSQRREKPFVVVNCGAIPEQLLESELFGHEKGAFTGAYSSRKGKFEDANGGTIFLDEIGELPLAMQVKLLRTLQEGTVERIGGRKPIPLSFRIIAATNADLKQAVAGGLFRQDLYYRLNVIPLTAPPLRDREDDVITLTSHFIEQERKALRLGRLTLSPAALAAIKAHPWPGNVRELKNAVRRALATVNGTAIQPEDLGLSGPEMGDKETPGIDSLAETKRRAEAEAVRQALALSGNNISQAARLLSVSRPTLHDLLKKYKITL
ncbi:Two component, sigma54 specific, transcriptional regulator, Fis family [uncultured Desulfobacterium sp.]|uniref:Two component, sigma54 specific, transcriptional regulator, Fis family n=1 Tax=uncultured Desulfobacterium sp. TaxID=201089 RepID=A0A445MZP7_9BACT|nr:Two component, sigma54 specific, transcriptional regulator, Fis family [uncultured Desulfobacterium sp.]